MYLANQISRVAAVAAFTIAGVAGVQLANPSTASARCIGFGHPVTTDLRTADTGARVAWETPGAITCNDDGTYTTTLSGASGWTPFLFSQNGGIWVIRREGSGPVAWSASSHQSQEILCAIHNSTGNGWCGTGTDVDLVVIQQLTNPAFYPFSNNPFAGLLSSHF